MTEPWWRTPFPAPDESAAAAAATRQGELTKPPGSLGRLERIAIDLAGLQGVERPALDHVHIAVFAADHGIAAEGVSAFPQAVTLEMVRNFARGGGAISVLARELGARLEVVDMGTAIDGGALDGVRRVRIGAGTANFRNGPAMSPVDRDRALDAGREVASEAADGGAQAFLGGEMGIANTTAATALACALLGAEPRALAGPGTGLNMPGLAHKVAVIDQALEHHGWPTDPMTALAALGGFEIAGLSGAFIASAQNGVPVLVDGFIASVAALVAVRACPALGRWLIATHRSAEPGHDRILAELELEPVLDLGMRLGEGSGAAVAVPILRSACAVHAGMATFAEAGVSGVEPMLTETVIDLLRHGEPAGGARLRGARTDDPLTEAGWSGLQRAVGTWRDWDLVATSPLARCHAFAAHLAAEPGAELVVDARLSEYDFGAWDGLPFERLWAESGDAVSAFFGDPDSAPPPDGEAAADFRARVRAAWADLLERAAGGRVLIVGHGGVLRQYVADTLGVPGNPHAALEWPHAAMSRIRVFDDPPYPQARSLVFHGRVVASEGEPGGET